MAKGKILDGISETQNAVLRYLRRVGSASRAQIADLCGITPAAVSMMTRDLLDRGVIAEGARHRSGRGAPHVDLTLQKSIGYALGVHANRYTLMLTLLDFRGDLVGEKQLNGSYDTFADASAAIRVAADELLAEKSIDRSALVGACVAMPTRFRKAVEPLDLAKEIISWARPDLTDSLRRTLGCPVVIENDANAATVGELTLGNSAGHENFAYLYLSEGIGGGIVIGKELYRGNLGNAGEFGALRGRGQSRPSFEDLVNWCVERNGHVPAGRAPNDWLEFLNDHPALLNGWLERAGPETARLTFPVAALLAPSAIYIGGTLPRPVRERLAAWLDFGWSDPFKGARVVQPQILLPDVVATDPVAFGAAAMILHQASELR